MPKIRTAVRALKSVAVLEDEVRRLSIRVADAERELIRVSPQLAALEVRVEALRAKVEAPSYAAAPEEHAEARSLVAEVKAEHARVRARISAATVFEERLRVLESKLDVHVPIEGLGPDTP